VNKLTAPAGVGEKEKKYIKKGMGGKNLEKFLKKKEGVGKGKATIRSPKHPLKKGQKNQKKKGPKKRSGGGGRESLLRKARKEEEGE